MRIDKLLFSALLASALFSSPLSAGKGPGYGPGNTGALTEPEEADLLFMREEEKLARDVYVTLFEVWGAPVFLNISGSEQRHMDAVEALLIRYGLQDPVESEGPEGVGLFVNEELGALYEELLAAGAGEESDLIDALHVGALIEEVDIEDLATAIERTEKPDIRRTYESLLCGSRNHLRAFARQVELKTGDVYETQLAFDDDDLAAYWEALILDIIDGPMERCGNEERRGR
jgi:hypothetical protein